MREHILIREKYDKFVSCFFAPTYLLSYYFNIEETENLYKKQMDKNMYWIFLENIKLPNSLSEIKNDAFIFLVWSVFPCRRYLQTRCCVFEDCKKLKSVKMPDQLIKFMHLLLKGAILWKRLRLSPKLKHIGYMAYGQHFGTKDGNTIPDKVEKLEVIDEVIAIEENSLVSANEIVPVNDTLAETLAEQSV